MKAYEITAEINLKKIIAESKEVAQALNEFVDDLERIESKYAEPQKESFKPKNDTIWLVSYWDFGSEPVTTAFNNEEAANKCYKYFKKCHELCCLDRCPIYSTFLESEETDEKPG